MMDLMIDVTCKTRPPPPPPPLITVPPKVTFPKGLGRSAGQLVKQRLTTIDRHWRRRRRRRRGNNEKKSRWKVLVGVDFT